jgi:hypothetical protein
LSAFCEIMIDPTESLSLKAPATYTAERYVQPLREGGSLPAVVETDGGLFVVKFRGAGQGAKSLIAELIVGLIGSHLGFPIPELALVVVPDEFGRSEPDPEIQHILRTSHGTNVGLRYLDGAFNFALAPAGDLITPEFAANLVWFDAFLTNPDRSHRNSNLLVWDRRCWLIDHGAALYAHHDWSRVDDARTRAPFPLIKDHILLSRAGPIEAADVELMPRLGEDLFRDVLAAVPDALLMDEARGLEFDAPGEARERYVRYLTDRLESPRAFVAEADAARQRLMEEPGQHLSSRR